jgi:hypothetical protein
MQAGPYDLVDSARVSLAVPRKNTRPVLIPVLIEVTVQNRSRQFANTWTPRSETERKRKKEPDLSAERLEAVNVGFEQSG